VSQVLRAPLEIGFAYTRSTGPTLSQFLAGLAGRRILGARAADGRVHAPPFEFDPVTFDPPAELVEVGPEGTVLTWTWTDRPLAGQPLDRPFGWALIRLDGADTGLLHAVDAGSAAAMRTGLRVRPRWAAERTGSIRDIEFFEPANGARPPEPAGLAAAGPVGMITTPIELSYEHTASAEESAFLRGLADGRLLGQRCPACGKVYLPPRAACPADGVPTKDEVEVSDTGTVTTFCVVSVPFRGQRVAPPYVAAAVLLDGADIAIQHLILGCEPARVRMGMRVSAVWKPREEWGLSLENIHHFEPADEPDAPYESYARHL
jgi:uncharacterized protein